MIIEAGIVYRMKYSAEQGYDQLAKLQNAINQETETISVLRAEWSRLNQPQRLQKLVQRHYDAIKLDQISVSQIGSIEEIPMRTTEKLTINKLIERSLDDTAK